MPMCCAHSRNRIGFTLVGQTICANGSTSTTGECPRTLPGFGPWEIVWYAGFSSEEAARAFECYLKSGSGRAFLRKRLLNRNSSA
jgi:hypothetical protein